MQAARERLRGSIYYSPCPHSQMLSALTGQQIYLKLENLQMTGSFKERGALNRIATLTPEQAARGVVAASAGNHAQGVAYHATKRGNSRADRDAAGDAAGEGDGDARLRRRGGAARRQLRRGLRRGNAHLRGRGDDVHPSLRRPGRDGRAGNDRAGAAGAGSGACRLWSCRLAAAG